jgi:hypothetical protein
MAIQKDPQSVKKFIQMFDFFSFLLFSFQRLFKTIGQYPLVETWDRNWERSKSAENLSKCSPKINI